MIVAANSFAWLPNISAKTCLLAALP